MKVAVERRRRDRINRALESLRHLLAENSYTDVVSIRSANNWNNIRKYLVLFLYPNILDAKTKRNCQKVLHREILTCLNCRLEVLHLPNKFD